MTRLRLVSLRKSFDGRVDAVGDVSLSIEAGEILTVLGPSGCGKSTLLRLIAGLEQPDAGEVYIDGTPVTGRSPRDRDVAMVFQSYALYPHMTVRENIATPLRLRRLPADDIAARVDAAVARLGLEGLLDRRPAALSGGERQRVALARALVRQPKAFLLDEPLSNLDALLRERARGELKSLFRQIGATVVYVTHDQTEALTLSTRVAVMRAGVVEQVATPEDIYARPATLFVAGFVGSPRMNLVPGAALGLDAPTVGIRPEHVRLSREAPRRMRIVLRETLGPQVLLTLRGEGHEETPFEITALAGADEPGAIEGDQTGVSFDTHRLHRFDARGRRLD